MDTFYLTIILSFCFALVLILFSIIALHGSNSKKADDFEYALMNNNIETSSLLDDFSDLSSGVFKEMEEKRQELLFLYNLIEEKGKGLASSKKPVLISNKGIDILVDDKMTPEQVSNKTPGSISITNKNSNMSKILELKEHGMTVAEIAKELSIGQGEVSLLIEIGKDTLGSKNPIKK